MQHHKQVRAEALYSHFLKFIEDRSMVSPCEDTSTFIAKGLGVTARTVYSLMKRAVESNDIVTVDTPEDRRQTKRFMGRRFIFRVSSVPVETGAARLATLLSGYNQVVADKALPANNICAQLLCSPDQLNAYTKHLLNSGVYVRGVFKIGSDEAQGWKRVRIVVPVEIPGRSIVDNSTGFGFKVLPVQKGETRHMTALVVQAEESERRRNGGDAATKIYNVIARQERCDLTYEKIAEKTGLNRTWVSETIKSMVDAGRVFKQKQGRRVILSVTPFQEAVKAAPSREDVRQVVEVAPVVYVAPEPVTDAWGIDRLEDVGTKVINAVIERLNVDHVWGLGYNRAQEFGQAVEFEVNVRGHDYETAVESVISSNVKVLAQIR